ncbi:MAG: hypothetical protein BLM47_10485 [Candidatus Reconcilbacillus cellulovorans]|uniref:Small, acid-soluble spore protein, H family n=1 Tax=Candidatus Reconcilbacillus cellulovorans TaxID=1906605 RepID=A0A2A6DXN9_9BACL|nr:MAG: hypothetical protein BLM47_10485 [Candidatus Reconcilbacillus cellulovorans]
MDVRRAREIMNSEDIVTVTWNGTPVWIERVDERTQTATVRLEGREETGIRSVPVAELAEK